MKVLQINTLARTQSTGRITYEMHMELKKRKIDSYVAVSCAGEDEEKYGQILVGNRIDMKIHAFMSRLTGLQGYYSFGATKELLGYIKNLAPDVVVIGVLHSNFLNINRLLIYLKENKIATVIVLHDLWFLTGHCFYPCMTGCSKYEVMCGCCNQKNMANRSFLFDTSKKIWKDRKKIFDHWEKLAIVGVSKWAADCAQKAAVIRNNKNICYIYNWIDSEKFYPFEIEFSENKETFTILGVSSSWSLEKGLNDFAKLSYMLEEDEKLIMVGRMRKTDKAKFNSAVVTFIEFTNSEQELSELYNKADVFVSMSTQETFGKTIAEAVCCGTPAVTYDQTASPEIVSDGCGYAVNMGNVEAVYEKVKLIRSNGKAYYGEACRKKALNEFDKCKNIDRYVELFYWLCRETKNQSTGEQF